MHAEFLVDRNGEPAARFGPSFDPLKFENYVSVSYLKNHPCGHVWRHGKHCLHLLGVHFEGNFSFQSRSSVLLGILQ